MPERKLLEPDRITTVKKDGTAPSEALLQRTHRWICRLVSEETHEQSRAVGSTPIVLGADPSCDLVLSDATVSRKHAEIFLAADGIRIRDLGSTNGTFYRSSKVDQITVTGDTEIRLGNTVVEILSDSGPSLPAGERRRFGGLIGESIPMRQIFSLLELVSPTEATVLINGESGTGKEIAARGIHDHSMRAKKPFVVVDCCSSPESLVESHLFGHRAGAFTGAVAERKGAFLEANGGTIFLDELGELPLPAQGKLLRVLEARTVQPVGSDRAVPVDVRVIAATHRDLLQMVREKKFRFDLYHRLAVVSFAMPALRSHIEDIPLLVRHFYEGRGMDPGAVDGENLRALRQYDWPGNVRELRNVLERAWVLSGPDGAPFRNLALFLGRGSGVPPASLPDIDTHLPFKEAKERWNDLFEARYVAEIYKDAGENISNAAKRADINRNHMRKLLLKHGIIR